MLAAAFVGLGLALTGLGFVPPARAVESSMSEQESFAWKDSSGAIHIVDDLEKVPPEARENLIGSGSELTELWDGDVLRALPLPTDAQMQFELLRTAHFEVFWERGLAAASGHVISLGGEAKARALAGLLEHAAREVDERLSLRAQGRISVLLYSRASYWHRYGEKFPFHTAGFFDGRIHVAANALDSVRLPGLIRHEYVHALFRETVGSHRPFWLNEGLAELAARRAFELTEDEKDQLRRWIEAGQWLPLTRLNAGFSHLSKVDVPRAYLESTAAAAWVLGKVATNERRKFLHLLGASQQADAAYIKFLGMPLAEFDSTLRAELGAGER